MVKPSVPDLSIVVLVHRDSEGLRGALRGVCGQSVSSQVECVLVVASREDVGGTAETLKGLFRSKIVEVGTMRSEG